VATHKGHRLRRHRYAKTNGSKGEKGIPEETLYSCQIASDVAAAAGKAHRPPSAIAVRMVATPPK
jgi:hypothetical protein